jgi:hypothetical protein
LQKLFLLGGWRSVGSRQTPGGRVGSCGTSTPLVNVDLTA